MASSTNCIYKTVTLQAGEQFNLPPGAVIIGSSDSSAFTSTCPIPDGEEAICYVAATPSSNDCGSNSSYWEPTIGTNATTNLWGYEFNGVMVPFASQKPTVNPGHLITTDVGAAYAEMALVMPILGTAFGYGCDAGYGCLNYFVIKTFPSIAKTLKMVWNIDGPVINNSQAFAWFEFVPISQYDTGRDGFPGCP